MYWFFLLILLLFFVPLLHLGLVFLLIFVFINFLLLIAEFVFRLTFRKKRPSPFFPRSRPTSPRGGPQSPPASPLRKDDDVEDAQFREEK